MSILINKSTRVIIQGITGREASFHSLDMLNYGTQIVAGVTPGKGGSWVLDEKVFTRPLIPVWSWWSALPTGSLYRTSSKSMRI